MADWQLTETDLKKYPHFDGHISAEAAQLLATDPTRVATHPFYPFILYSEAWTRFAPKGSFGEPKSRPIRYAARRDAYIFSYYRHLLAEKYEAELVRQGLASTVLAYRPVKRSTDGRGKCNIDFALDGFNAIRASGDCTVLALDISQFFETLDHRHLKSLWCRLLGVDRLEKDHFQVYSAITQYAVVKKLAAYERLGHFGPKTDPKTGAVKPGFLTTYASMPRHLCRGDKFRAEIAGKSGKTSIIEKNYKPYGIPQGAAISDLLANLYMLDFDAAVSRYVKALSGTYFRYSDDILIVIPGHAASAADLLTDLKAILAASAPRLVFKDKKTCIYRYSDEGAGQSFERIEGTQGRNGLEYLGFRYDGKQIYIRDATISGLHRKIARAAKRVAHAHATRFPDKGLKQLIDNFAFEDLIKSFGRVEEFYEKSEEYDAWTFWTYAKRAARILGPSGRTVLHQLRHLAKWVRLRAVKELEAAVRRRDKHGGSVPLRTNSPTPY